MDISTFLFVLCFLQTCHLSSSKSSDTLVKGTSLSVEKTNDALISANGVFSAGFLKVGDHAFCFAIWFKNTPNHAVVWMANRDQPVGARNSKLSLLKNGNLILKDADHTLLWTTNTVSHSSVELQLLNTGNLILRTWEDVVLWESFDFPTDTLLPKQPLTKDIYLISSRSQRNYSSGNYKLFFDNNNVLSLLFQDADVSSVYWPSPESGGFSYERTTYNSSRIAVLDLLGHFVSSDDLQFFSADYGIGPFRRLTLDPDGQLRLYSLEETNSSWIVSWQGSNLGCRVHGLCGPNGVCSFDPGLGRRCSCLTGHKVKSLTNWSNGCEPQFRFSSKPSDFTFVKFIHVDFYGYDEGFYEKISLKECEGKCLELRNCRGFQYKFDTANGYYSCYPKTSLLNGLILPDFPGDLYLKLPRGGNFSNMTVKKSRLYCSNEIAQQLNRMYRKAPENGAWEILLWFATTIGVVEVTFICLVWCFLHFRTNQDAKEAKQGYLLAAPRFKKFNYAELKKATKGFSEEIGRGGGGVVYKAKLSDGRVAAIKRLNEANQGEAEFLAEVRTIWKLNHMNLIEMWGFCAEGKHRLLVYEYMEHGSLADNLSSGSLDWKKRFEIAVGTAKGLAYLHDECLQWVLHCDIKPQNILLDSNDQPKVSDFGLSKLLNRGALNNPSFSRIRGTRGYMAPEWVYNLPITSKVDVYSYGVVLLEMITGKSPMAGFQTLDIEGETEHRRLVTWAREKINGAPNREAWLEEIVDPLIASNYVVNEMAVLVKVALQCVEEDMDARITMRQAVELMCNEEAHT